MEVVGIMCVKDEADLLPEVLEHLKDKLDVVYAYDDGSIDGTLQILRDHAPFVSYLIATKDAPAIEMPMEFAKLTDVLSKTEESPSDQYQELTRYRMEKVREMAIDDPFSIDWLLAYMVLLILMENWYELDEGRGKQMLNKIVKETA